MADIDQIIAGGAKTNADFDFSKILDSYRKGVDWRYQQDQRNVFKDDKGNFRQDLLDPAGNPDGTKLYERLMAVGGVPNVDAAAKAADTTLQMQRYRNAPAVQSMIDGTDRPPPVTTDNFPPSGSRNAPAVVAPPLPRGGVVPQRSAPAGSPQGDQPGSIVGMVSDAGIPDQTAGPVIINLAKSIGVDPNKALSPEQTTRAQAALAGFKTRNGIAAQPAPQAGQSAPAQQTVLPQAVPGQSAPIQPTPVQTIPIRQAQTGPVPASQAPTDPTLGGLIPPGYPDAGVYLRRQERVLATVPMLPEQQKLLQAQIEGIRKALEPTPEMKNARAAGMGIVDYRNLDDRNKEQLQVLEKSILPKLDKSQDSAIAARDEILAMHRSREQLDAPGGIFSGAAADVRLKLAKFAEVLGVPNVDKIANTESFSSAIGSRVLSLVKGLGSGTAISNADREFAAGMAGGQIKLDEGSIRRILDIGEKAARSRIDLHNGLTDRTLKATEALRGYSDVYHVEAPGSYQRAGSMPAPKVGAVIGGHRFLGGNPNSRQSWGAL